MSDSYDVAICGYYGMGNLGDELLLCSVIDRLQNLGISRSRIVVFSGNPNESARNFGVAAVSRWSPSSVWRGLRRSRTCLFGGGGLFQDVTSLRSVLYYGGIVVMAVMAGCRPWVFGNSLGPFRTRTGWWLTRLALNLCVSVVLRDRPSMEEAQSMGISAQNCPDLVTALNVSSGSGDVVLVNLRPWDGQLERQAARWMAEYLQRSGCPSIAVAMCPGDGELLHSLIRNGDLPRMPICFPKGGDDPVWSQGRIALGMRLHFCVLSSLAGLPGVAIPYDPKVSAFARSVGYEIWKDGKLLEPSGPDLEWLSRCRTEIDYCFRRSWQEVVES